MKRLSIACLLALGTARLLAQTTVTTTGGSAGTVPAFSGASTIVNSPISYSGAFVGLNAPPQLSLSLGINGTGINLDQPYEIGIWTGNTERFQVNGNTGLVDLNGTMFVQGDANVGIGTSAPSTVLHVVGSNWNGLTLTNSADANTMGDLKNDPIGTYVAGKRFLILSDETPSTDGSNGGIMFRTNNSSNLGNAIPAMVIRANGAVGVGTVNPQFPVDVTGVINAEAGVRFPDGQTQTTAWTGALCGGDYAESVNADGDRKGYEPGDVLVIASESKSDIEKSVEPYSTLVAGVFATKPGAVGRRQTTAKSPDEVPMAMVGIVPTKVSAENGPVHKGDLLVTSSTPGYAMKGTDRERMMGAVVGKALGSLASGTGVIEVLVTLQ
jgi:hypothetical protein